MASHRTSCLLILYIILHVGVITHANEPVISQDSVVSGISDVSSSNTTYPTFYGSKGNTKPDFPKTMPRTIPCPAPGDIWPCACTPIDNVTMDINCSNVTSDGQLRYIFSREFPFRNFRSLVIQGNFHVNALQEGDLGTCSFVNIDIRDSALITIDDFALEGSLDTLEALVLINNNIRYIPDISAFSRLNRLDFQYNALTEFPFLNSSTLQTLILRGFPFGVIPPTATWYLPALAYADFAFCYLTEISNGTFTHNEQLSYLELGSNSLKSIPKDAFRMSGANNTLLLQGNLISDVDPEAFSGITGKLTLNSNRLQVLQEEIWRPLLEANVMLYLAGNSFTCGCDIAWLILNPTLLWRVHDEATCFTGQKFVELDPAWYINMC
ncbi:oplophorus-luciferin 2-monooxygenase non-catalytic subunit-like [Macrobrachium rosenbergii]|uniref:oplophorus-luciferin 2-monooxygenase non-catalytic subunit-like n=1 Tax=Macrobrachium rosenbergii TaxID=79674 RepID=UPI0034D3FCC5